MCDAKRKMRPRARARPRPSPARGACRPRVAQPAAAPVGSLHAAFPSSAPRRPPVVSALFDPAAWTPVAGFDDLTDVTYHRAAATGAVRIAFDRPDVLNAFRPRTVDELFRTLDHARQSPDVGCVLLTGNGPSAKHGKWAFSSGGDQRIRGKAGYEYADGETGTAESGPAESSPAEGDGRRRRPRAEGAPWAAAHPGGAAPDSLHAEGRHRRRARLGRRRRAQPARGVRPHAREPRTRPFKQTDADVASFDGGFGSAYLARQVGQKAAREIFFLGRTYSAEDAHRMGMVNAVIPHDDLEATALEWAREINGKSPTAIRMLKFAFNSIDDGLVGQQVFAGEATRLAYRTDEAQEGRDAFLEKRDPDWSDYPWYF